MYGTIKTWISKSDKDIRKKFTYKSLIKLLMNVDAKILNKICKN